MGVHVTEAAGRPGRTRSVSAQTGAREGGGLGHGSGRAVATNDMAAGIAPPAGRITGAGDQVAVEPAQNNALPSDQSASRTAVRSL